MSDENRRAFLTIATAGALLVACRNNERAAGGEPSAARGMGAASTNPNTAHAPQRDEEEVGATEDLMREHGVIRRVLVAYREAAAKLRAKPAAVPSDTLQKAAKLIREFGEDYHEKQLEEAHIFPPLTKNGGPIATTVSTLIAQHQRGREITDYVLSITQKAIGAQAAEPLARTLEAFARMYEEHAAIEDTIVFPAWKKTLSAKELDEMGDKFEDIERKTFGKDGFDDAVEQVASIEKALGVDLAAMTAPPPPKS